MAPPAPMSTDRICVAPLDDGTTALILWQDNESLVVVAHTIPPPALAGVARHARTHVSGGEIVESSAQCAAPVCSVAHSWTPQPTSAVVGL